MFYIIQILVSADKNIENLLENNQFDIVISSSGLNKIMYGSDVNEDWDLPVLVKQIKVGETVKNVVYIDKPLPKKHPTNAYFSHKCTKLMLRTNFCKYEAFRYKNYPVDFINTFNAYEFYVLVFPTKKCHFSKILRKKKLKLLIKMMVYKN